MWVIMANLLHLSSFGEVVRSQASFVVDSALLKSEADISAPEDERASVEEVRVGVFG